MKKSFILIIYLLSCSDNINHENIDLVINDAQSYKYDFKEEIYTVFFIDRPPLKIKFNLSKEEKKSINEKYYELNLNELPQNLIIEGDCNLLPQLFTELHIKSNDTIQEIKVESACNDFTFFNKGKAKKVKSFLEFIYKILNSRPLIRNSLKSNIPYM